MVNQRRSDLVLPALPHDHEALGRKHRFDVDLECAPAIGRHPDLVGIGFPDQTPDRLLGVDRWTRTTRGEPVFIVSCATATIGPSGQPPPRVPPVTVPSWATRILNPVLARVVSLGPG